MATPEPARQAVTGPADQPTSSPGQAAAGPPVARPPAPRGRRRRALTRPRVAVPAGALLYLLGLALPWFSTPAYDAGFGYRAPASTVNGFDAGMLVVAAVLLVLAAAWTLLPRPVLRLPFPGALVTAGLATVALLITVPEWLTTLDRGLAAAGLLAVLSAAVACAVALAGAVPAVRTWPAAAPRPAEPAPAADEGADETPPAAGTGSDEPSGGAPAGRSPAAPPAETRPGQHTGSADDELWADPRRRRTGPGGASATAARE